jgi:acetyl-CoA carboxylase carboxyl transferase alpha subunit
MGMFMKAQTQKNELKAYERVLLARDKERPNIVQYISCLFDSFLELSGDRIAKEDASVLGGIGFFEGRPVTVIGHHKGKDLEENLSCNFGMPGPEGFRKSLRLMKQAEKFHRPVITLLDTSGAYPGMEAESNGQSTAIAENLLEMGRLKTPVVAIVTGEGCSGGALALGVADKVWMLENAVYSVLSPEGFASILWKDAGRKEEAAERMRMTARELLEDGLVDGVIPEPEGGIQKDPQKGMEEVRKAIRQSLEELDGIPGEELARRRQEKYLHIASCSAPGQEEA